MNIEPTPSCASMSVSELRRWTILRVPLFANSLRQAALRFAIALLVPLIPTASAVPAESPGNNPPHSLEQLLQLVAEARKHAKAGDNPAAANSYRQALAKSTELTEEVFSVQQRCLLRAVSAPVLIATGDAAAAIDCLSPLCDGSLPCDKVLRRRSLRSLAKIAAQALREGEYGLAKSAYGKLLSSIEEADELHATALLGRAWTLAASGHAPEEAADHLLAFIAAYPGHPDAPQAAEASVQCLSTSERHDKAADVRTEIISRWPDSPAARRALQQFEAADVDDLPAPVIRWIAKRADDPSGADFGLDMTAIALRLHSRDALAESQSESTWDQLLLHLAALDKSGEVTLGLLHEWSRRGDAGTAERMATKLIAPDGSETIRSSVREAACLWAGRTQRWMLLALAAEASHPGSKDESRTLTIERLLAESLMHTGRPDVAKEWWKHLVDRRGCTDFPTLLRCAETSVSTADIPEASRRIDAARDAAGEDVQKLALVDVLAAELAIRQIQFDKARQVLTELAANAAAPSDLRGRAQWLIGETHYLQHRFQQAIDAYRKVESIDNSGGWTSAALLQAGKSFEQLGRTDKAAVCYTALVGQFADSAYAETARRRLAELATDEPNRNQTLRR